MQGIPFRTLALLACALLSALFVTGCGFTGDPLLPETTVAPLAGEDLAKPCTYALRLAVGPVPAPRQPPASIPQSAVLVVFERADSLPFFDDPNVMAAAQSMHMAMLYAYQCNAKSFADLQPEASAGPGRALFQALNQFAVSQNHPELANINVFLSGFSASAFLSVTTAIEYPGRVLGVMPYAPGDPYDNTALIPVSPQAARLPLLMLTSDQDGAAGDQIPMFLFLNGYTQGGPWGFAVQHAIGHCCMDSIAPIVIPWMTAIVKNYTTTDASGRLSLQSQPITASPTVAFQIATDGVFDPATWQDFYISTYSLLPSASGGPFRAWLPDQATTNEWVSWVTNPNGNLPAQPTASQ